MFDINALNHDADQLASDKHEPLAKAHPAASLVKDPNWRCDSCGHNNPITAPFCEKCSE